MRSHIARGAVLVPLTLATLLRAPALRALRSGLRSRLRLLRLPLELCVLGTQRHDACTQLIVSVLGPAVELWPLEDRIVVWRRGARRVVDGRRRDWGAAHALTRRTRSL